MNFCRVACAVLLVLCGPAVASQSISTEPGGQSYTFVSHFEKTIDAPVGDVWPILTDLSSWMNEFELSHVSGEPGEEGAVMRLYPEQEFYIQLTQIIPNRLLAITNLPSTFQGEQSTGVGVILVHEAHGKTKVSITLSRRYTWNGEGENPIKAHRQSGVFQENTRAMWEDRFLGNLKTLSEAASQE